MSEESATPETLETNALGLTAQIVAAHVSRNGVTPDSLQSRIPDVYSTLSYVWREPHPAEKPQSAAPIKKSVVPDHVVYPEDGTKLKMLKGHLNTSFNMTSDQNRERRDPPADYPMVGPRNSQHWCSLATKLHLGTKPRTRNQ